MEKQNGGNPLPDRMRGVNGVVVVLMLVVGGCFIFLDLGHYALWDDEANTALIGEGVWRTGDTSALVGKNIVAYRGGVELSHLKERYLPPLQYFVVAPFVGVWPGSAWAARFPFAVAGLASIGLIFGWLWSQSVEPLTLILAAMAFIGNVSFWLYLRQCRYYSLSVFFSLAVAFLYLTCPRKPWVFVAMSLLSIGLLASNYMNYAALYGILGIDCLLWNRRGFRVGVREGVWLWVPQIIVGVCILSIWNPLDKNVFGGTGISWSDRIRLFWWAWRDLNRCEFGALSLLGVAPIVAYWRGNRWLMRASVALLGYVLIVAILTPQDPSLPMNAVLQPIRIFDVRYLSPAIPLMIGVGVLTVRALLPGPRWWPALALGAVAWWTNILQGGALVGDDARAEPAPIAHSALALYVGELLRPPSDPYTVAANWINQHVPTNQTIWVLPEHMVYPLMFHAPGAIYAWQLPHNPPPELRGLDPAMYQGREMPDYLICFGPDALRRVSGVRFLEPAHACEVARLDYFWRDLYRPELAWRSFGAVADYDADLESIHIFRLERKIRAKR